MHAVKRVHMGQNFVFSNTYGNALEDSLYGSPDRMTLELFNLYASRDLHLGSTSSECSLFGVRVHELVLGPHERLQEGPLHLLRRHGNGSAGAAWLQST